MKYGKWDKREEWFGDGSRAENSHLSGIPSEMGPISYSGGQQGISEGNYSPEYPQQPTLSLGIIICSTVT